MNPSKAPSRLLQLHLGTGAVQPLNCMGGGFLTNGFSGVLVHPGPRLPAGIISSEFNARKIINFHPQVYFWGSLPINSANRGTQSR